jgi:hypothetical protein
VCAHDRPGIVLQEIRQVLKIVADQPIVEKHHIRIKKGKDGELTIKGA